MSLVSSAPHHETLARLATSVRGSVVQTTLRRFQADVADYSFERLSGQISKVRVRATRLERELLEATATLDASACQRALAAVLEARAELKALTDEFETRAQCEAVAM